MEKKKKPQEINLEDIKTMKVSINISVPKEEFDELLRRMAHFESRNTPQEDEPKNKKEKKNDL